MSVSKKVVIVNAIAILILAIISVAVSSFITSSTFRNSSKNDMVDIVTANANKIEALNGEVPEHFDFVVNNVFLSVYYSNGSLKEGSSPVEISETIKEGVFREIKIDGVSYYVFDCEIELEGRSSIYLRGISTAPSDEIRAIQVGIIIAVLITVIVAFSISIFMIRKAVSPIEQMKLAVREISESRDLSKRLNVKCSDKGLMELQKEYNRALDNLENIFHIEERFTSDVSHELRTPLTIILAECEYALEEAKSEEEKQKSLEVIKKQTKRLVLITNQLLEYSKFTNKINVELIETNLSSLLEEIECVNNSKNIKVDKQIQDNLIIKTEPTLFIRMVRNLVDNAIKYGKENGFCKISLIREGENVTLTVEDNGIGMSNETLEKVFERFYQEDASRSNQNGLGLGLCFVKEIVRLLGGKIEIESSLGVGTKVIIIFNN